MKKGLLFTCIIALLFWTIPSWAWYPEQEKDGVKDTTSPEEAQKLVKEGTYGMRKDYEPKPGFPWPEDIEKGTLKAEQLMYLADSAKEQYGFYTRLYHRSSIFMNARGRYSGVSGAGFRYYDYNEDRKMEDGDNYGDVLTYHEGKIKAGDVFMRSSLHDYYPPQEVGKSTLELFNLKTPEVYKEPDRWVYLPGRRKVMRLGAASKAQLRGAGIATYDDTGGRMVWEHEHKIIGTYVLKPEDLYFGKNGFWDGPTSLKTKVPIKQPVECYVILSKPREPGYYLGQSISWIKKVRDPKHWQEIHTYRLEQYDRANQLWKIWEDVFEVLPHNKDGEPTRLGDETWDLRRDFRDQVVFRDGFDTVHNTFPWEGGPQNKAAKRQWFSIDNIKSEQTPFEIPSPADKYRRARFDIWKNTNPPYLLRDRFPEYRKIVLRSEIEEKIRKLVEKGIFE